MSEVRPRHPLYEITRARLLEFWRQPEALFWVFAFPVIMAVVLGLAFRSKPPAELQGASPAELLAWGIAHWDAARIPRSRTLAEAQLR